MRRIQTPISDEMIKSLNVGDMVYISGYIFVEEMQFFHRL